MATISNIYQGFNSLLSLRPLVAVLKKMVSEGKPGAKKLYQGLIAEIESRPELLEPMADTTLISRDTELVETLLSTIFPPSTSSTQGIYAISFPFRSETIYASPGFKELFLKDGSNNITLSDSKTNIDIGHSSLGLIYDIILKKIFNLPVTLSSTSVYPFKDDNGLTSYYELKLNAQFVDVKTINNFKAPSDFIPTPPFNIEELKQIFPLQNFEFEGLVVIEVNDVTQDQVILEIKNELLNINSFSEVTVYDGLQIHVQSLIGLKNVQIGITPFFKMNGYYLHTDSLYKNSLLFKSDQSVTEKDRISEECQNFFKLNHQPLLFETLTEEIIEQNPLLHYYAELGAKSLMLCPLRNDNGRLIGLLEILDANPEELQVQHLAKIQPSISLFTLALEKSGESIELQIDKMIKEHFTAIQPAVEWKFTEAAFNYLQHRQVSELAKMPSITFDDVYPLYAAIDVRNSSTERNHSIQLDLMEQLTMAKDLLLKASKVMEFPLLKETQYRIDKYITSVSDTLLSDDELLLYDFLQNDLDSILRNLRVSNPQLKKMIDAYLNALDPQRKVIYHHRKEYEESITRINDVLDRFIDQEQKAAQEVYPHYFERYVTDGIEFNIYVGQSLVPHKPFNEMYVRNLKLWQITMLAKAARLTSALEKRLSLSLQTTQLILAHSIPLSIS
ncbi:MAG: hypothetical protein ACXWV9_09200, partial [Flavisolibacter sp.]